MASALIALALPLAATVATASDVKIDPNLPVYQPTTGVAGNMDSIGSDTLNNLMTFWAESFKKHYPNVKIQVEGKGSSTAPPALIAGTANIAPMSRKMKSTEEDEFEKKYGFKPTPIGVALDSLAVFVNKDNPVSSLTMQQVDAIFSKTRKSGAPADITTWKDIALDSPLAKQPISLYGRNSASGTYGYFKERALAKGDYKDTVKEQPGSAAVVMGITEDRAGIGYSGIGYVTSGVRPLALAAKEGAQAYEANMDNVLKGKYPLSRMLYVYVIKEPNKPLAPLQREFLKFVLSAEGQEIVVKDGYMPLPAAIVEKELQKL
ncbi:MAG: phosphate ABC transporter substrate-binding protein [Proteobacteria bacterium]|nr:phosphate ABC transporter substrate-binding protein [Desulfobulbaceae bacterium]MBU4153433.1 phosphate ABC transporter substrate-binding protein [Pseudomonadota bacterium]